MKATTTIGEYSLSDSARVEYTPCATGDSILDNQSVRDSLIANLARGRPDANPANWREQGGWIYKDQSGNYVVINNGQFATGNSSIRLRWSSV